MKNINRKKAILILKDGTMFEGKSIGIEGTAVGEICFNTGTTGYQEIFTDPSYYGQLMVTTNAHIGNYGINHDEEESEGIKISGLVCRNFSFDYSRVNAQESLLDYFKKLGLKRIHACHCTDLQSKIALSEVVEVKEVGVGLSLTY